MPATRSGTPAPVVAQPAKTGRSSPARVWATSPAQLRGRREPPFDVRREEAVVVLGQRHRLAVTERRVVGPVPHEARGPRPGAGDDAHGQHVGGEPRPHRGQRPVQRGARPVDLVHEQQGRHAEPWSARKRIRVCGCTPSTADSTSTAASRTPRVRSTSAMKSGVPRGVDDVDGAAGQRERHDRGLDRDTAAAFDREAVGAGGAGVDRPRFVDDPARCRSRSVRVVLPASTWARMPRLSVRGAGGTVTRDPLRVEEGQGGHVGRSHRRYLLAGSVPVVLTVGRGVPGGQRFSARLPPC